MIVYGLNPKGLKGELEGVFVDGQIMAKGWRTLVVTNGKYTETSDYRKSSIDKFHYDLLRRIAIEGDRESRIWAVEALMEIRVG